MTVDIIDYVGKYNNGVIVLISLGYENNHYEATFYYDSSVLALTPDTELEKKLGCYIEEWIGYEDVIDEILSKVLPYDDIIEKIGEFDPADYNLYLDTGTQSIPEQNNIQ